MCYRSPSTVLQSAPQPVYYYPLHTHVFHKVVRLIPFLLHTEPSYPIMTLSPVPREPHYLWNGPNRCFWSIPLLSVFCCSCPDEGQHRLTWTVRVGQRYLRTMDEVSNRLSIDVGVCLDSNLLSAVTRSSMPRLNERITRGISKLPLMV